MFTSSHNLQRYTDLCLASSAGIRRLALVAISLMVIPCLAESAEYKSPVFGTPLSPTEISQLPQHVFADGAGLPEGSGSTDAGKRLYGTLCASCHGKEGEGGRALELVGDRSFLNTDYPDRGIAVYWPYAPTLYEYIYRSMPPDNPASLESNEMYSLLAYLLFLNDLLEEGAELNAQTLGNIMMPNASGFRTIGR